MDLKVEDFARPWQSDTTSRTNVASVTETSAYLEAHAALRKAARTYVDAVTAFREFEREHPNDSTRRWEAVFDTKNNAYEALVTALAKTETVVSS